MRVDRMYFQKFEEQIKQDGFAVEKAATGDLESIIKYIEEKVFDKPEEFFNLEKLRKSIRVDRRVSLREIVEVIFGLKPYFMTKDELLDEEFEKFDSRYLPDEKHSTPPVISSKPTFSTLNFVPVSTKAISPTSWAATPPVNSSAI